MMKRFEGQNGRRLLINALRIQKLIACQPTIADELSNIVELIEVNKGSSIIHQDEYTNEIYFILLGSFSVIVNGREVAKRGPGDHVGEMGAIEPTQKRAATVTASQDSLVAKISESAFTDLGERYPILYKTIAQELARRLLQRNQFVRPTHDKVRVFIICSAEALPVARLIHSGLQHDNFDVILWSEGVFKVTNYTLQTLEDEVNQADFAIAVAYGDDITSQRGTDWPVPRDNVIFELGLFMGRLGRARAILMEPREERVKLPSDLAGVTTIGYRYVPGKDESSHIAPAVNALRTHIQTLGPQ
ncbi:nucleotide-binding protein [Janthinobacterium sp. SUN176]|uniref:TIR domain-containing protein n=1 Tax=Janthinobacterium sp. SUN176 TaxID=3014788 RepID=UPI002712F8F6|nr:TIR domain-containing protein [Janthinobacterium sp. SUN176]MDO8074769.1 nucleotide-binding protein [Janthinobacterium sp. SUN176]